MLKQGVSYITKYICKEKNKLQVKEYKYCEKVCKYHWVIRSGLLKRPVDFINLITISKISLFKLLVV